MALSWMFVVLADVICCGKIASRFSGAVVRLCVLPWLWHWCKMSVATYAAATVENI